MNKTINLSAKDNAERLNKDRTERVQKTSSKPFSTLTVAIAALCGFAAFENPAQAGFNIPTDMTPSPLCINGQCAAPFTAKMVLFEEFGVQDYQSVVNNPPQPHKLPPVAGGCDSMPLGNDLDSFLSQPLFPMPTKQANLNTNAYDINHPEADDPYLENPWELKIENCYPSLGDIHSNTEGRPTGINFEHQRYEEFPTKGYFQSAQTGARTNGGLRDTYQRHGYSVGEFSSGGLYYVDYLGADGQRHPGNKGVDVKIHPNLPSQDPKKVWTFDGTLPPKLLQARYGETLIFRHYNALPIDDGANGGFGKHTITTHEHNGHNPAESDGFAGAYFYPGQYYDYHWPMVLAGHDSINTGATDPWAGAPDGNGGITQVPGDWHETMSTHWFHDHMVDFTAQNVYKGNAAMMNYYSSIDRGREPANSSEAFGVPDQTGLKTKPGYACNYADSTSPNLCLPSGSGLDWGNRDYDVNLLVADKAWDNSGQLKFNIFNTDGFLGDHMTVNWMYKPYMEVRKRKYRFRILNGSVSRIMKIALVDSAGNKIKYHMIGNDGNLLEYALPFPNAESPDALPQQSIAERYDIIVDFAQPIVGNVYFVNIQEHQSGVGPSKVIPLASILNGSYKADYKNGDPAVGKFLELRIKGCGADGLQTCTDLSMKPTDYEPGKKNLFVRRKFTTQELQTAKHRTFEFVRIATTDNKPWAIATNGGAGLNADMNRVSSAFSSTGPEGSVEIWHIKSSGGWLHPVHVHFEEGQIIYRDGKTPPSWEKYGRKDMYRVGGPGPLPDLSQQVDMAIRVREFAGTYVEHCHNTQHEDHAMLLRWDSLHPGQTIPIPSPELGWEGVTYKPSSLVPTYLTGDPNAAKKFIIPPQ